jgi:hypothetical protein
MTTPLKRCSDIPMCWFQDWWGFETHTDLNLRIMASLVPMMQYDNEVRAVFADERPIHGGFRSDRFPKFW